MVVGLGLLGLKSYRERTGRGSLLDEAKRRIERKQLPLAVGYLSRYLELNPDDLDALDLKARLLAEGVQNESQGSRPFRSTTRSSAATPAARRRAAGWSS